ncbi:MAG: 30S ribosomal protein S8 [archaeon]
MSLNDPIADALNAINNAESVAKQTCALNYSKFLEGILIVLRDQGYIKQYKIINKRPVRQLIIYLDGKINKCKAIKPRYAVKKDEFEKFEKSYLISRDIGLLIVSTTSGLMTHNDAKTKGLGGRLVAYVY